MVVKWRTDTNDIPDAEVQRSGSRRDVRPIGTQTAGGVSCHAAQQCSSSRATRARQPRGDPDHAREPVGYEGQEQHTCGVPVTEIPTEFPRPSYRVLSAPDHVTSPPSALAL